MKFAVALLALAATAAGAQGSSPQLSLMAPISGEPSITAPEPAAKLHASAVAKTSSVRFLPVEAGRVDNIRKRNALSSKVLQVGFNRELRDEGETLQSPRLEFTSLASGQTGKVARLSVDSPDALAMRVGLQIAALPEGVELRFTGSGQSDVVLVTAAEIAAGKAEGLYWTPVTEGSTQLIEIYVPEGASLAADALKVSSVSHMFASPSGKFNQAKDFSDVGASSSCNVDAACSMPASAALANARKAVAKMLFQARCDPFNPSMIATCLCTGTLLNDVDHTTQVPYFYSANHCIGNQTEASTLTTYWFFEYPTCAAGIASGSLTPSKQLTGGATLVYRDVNRDALLLRLNKAAPAGAYFSGWDPNSMVPTANTAVTGIHHPRGDLKKVSTGAMVGFTQISDSVMGISNQSYITVGWLNGTTEGGSSGSGLFTLANSEYFLRGGLLGGDAGCFNSGSLSNPENRDYYSRFDQVYPTIKSLIGNTRVMTAVEYYNTVLNHYFITAAQLEMDIIDRGEAGPGWVRTGQTFPVYSGPDTANPAITSVCRFYGTPGIGPNSHFYGAGGDCPIVKADPGWTYEGLAFAVRLPDANQICPEGTVPLYRAYNNGHVRNDANHRYSTSMAIITSTPGYQYENVAMCVPVQAAPFN